MASELRLRPLCPLDEDAALAAHDVLAGEHFDFLLDYVPGETWASYLRRMHNQSRGVGLAPDRVPATFLVAVVNAVLVGRISIRHELNDYLATYGGHIGYAVVPEHRRKGYASDMLRQGLIIARSLGLDSVLLACDDDNTGSACVIEANGGLLDCVVVEPGSPVSKRRYWIR